MSQYNRNIWGVAELNVLFSLFEFAGKLRINFFFPLQSNLNLEMVRSVLLSIKCIEQHQFETTNHKDVWDQRTVKCKVLLKNKSLE